MSQPQSNAAQLNRKAREKCSPAVKALAQKLIDQGTPEDSAWAIAQSQVGESAGLRPIDTPLREAEIDKGKRSVRCVVITEGLGNQRDMRYYGPEAIDDIGKRIDGAKCYVNHKTMQQEIERPEGDLWSLAGYWKDGTVESMENGRRRVVATLVCDDSETGEAAYQKCVHALQYDRDLAESSDVYCGISINGDGVIESRKMTIDGNEIDVNYVANVTALPSADIVTQPARGGRVLALVESIAGCSSRREAKGMAIEAIKALLGRLFESARGKDAKKDEIVSAAVTEAEAIVAAAAKPAKESEVDETEDEAKGKREACRGSEDEVDESDGEDEEKDGDGEPDGDEPKGGKVTKTIKHEERHVMTPAEAQRKIRDLEKQVREGRALEAKRAKAEIQRQLTEANVTELKAEDVMAMSEADRKVVMTLIRSTLRETVGATMRGEGGGTAGDFARTFAAAIGHSARGGR
jgi:hypothetical protein